MMDIFCEKMEKIYIATLIISYFVKNNLISENIYIEVDKLRDFSVNKNKSFKGIVFLLYFLEEINFLKKESDLRYKLSKSFNCFITYNMFKQQNDLLMDKEISLKKALFLSKLIGFFKRNVNLEDNNICRLVLDTVALVGGFVKLSFDNGINNFSINKIEYDGLPLILKKKLHEFLCVEIDREFNKSHIRLKFNKKTEIQIVKIKNLWNKQDVFIDNWLNDYSKCMWMDEYQSNEEEYYEVLVKICDELFNTNNLSKQPIFIGFINKVKPDICFKLIKYIINNTIRGKHIDNFPVYIAINNSDSSCIKNKYTKSSVSNVGYVFYDLKNNQLGDGGVIDNLDINDSNNGVFIDNLPMEKILSLVTEEKITSTDNFKNSVIKFLENHIDMLSSLIDKYTVKVIHRFNDICYKDGINKDASLTFLKTVFDIDKYVLKCARYKILPKGMCGGINIIENHMVFDLHMTEFSIETAGESYIDALLKLEKSYPKFMRSNKKTILSRLRSARGYQFIIKDKDEIGGVLYTQPIINKDNLNKAKYNVNHLNANASGDLLQLISINTLKQSPGLSHVLIDFISVWSFAKYKNIYAITRCADYKEMNFENYESYVNSNSSDGLPVDSIIRMHVSHGAKIKNIISDYRPEDRSNHSNGVLVHYDLNDIVKRNKIKYNSDEFNSFSRNFCSKTLAKIFFGILGEFKKNKYSRNSAIRDMGIDSIGLTQLQMEINKHFNVKYNTSFLFEHNTPQAIEDYFSLNKEIDNSNKLKPNNEMLVEKNNDKIAVIGMGCLLPKDICSPEEYWSFLIEGKNSITYYPHQRLTSTNFKYGYKGGFIERIFDFDPRFFCLSPKECEFIDPQQRMILQTAWSAIEYAGINPKSLKNTNTGVFVGQFNNDYGKIISSSYNLNDVGSYLSTGNSSSITSGRLAYLLGLKGPAMTIDTACSSSLVAFNLGCDNLIEKKVDTAIVGGVNAILTEDLTISFDKAGMLSKDGLCKPFSASANGYVRSEGCIVLVLKRLNDAIKNKDCIHAVIEGYATNQDGASNGLTAPNLDSQKNVYLKALQNSNIKPEEVSYVEAHGTGTPLGDSIEYESISSVYGCDRNNTLFIGAVKGNIGHTESAAGLVGLLKVIMAIKNKYIPKNINIEKINPAVFLHDKINLVSQECVEWLSPEPRVAAVSSFGFSGTNAHVIVKEYKNTDRITKRYNKSNNKQQIITISAKTEKSLISYLKILYKYISENYEISLDDFTYTLQVGREQMKYRVAFLTKSKSELKNILEKYIYNMENNKNEYLQCNLNGSFVNHKSKDLNNNDWWQIEDIKKCLQNNNYQKVADKWLQGYNIDWLEVYKAMPNNMVPKKLNLPTYPFERTHLVCFDKEKLINRTKGISNGKDNFELLHKNKSTLDKYLFSSEFRLDMFCCNNLKRCKYYFLPFYFYLDLVYESLNYLMVDTTDIKPEVYIKSVEFSKCAWSDNQDVELEVSLYEANEEFYFEVVVIKEMGEMDQQSNSKFILSGYCNVDAKEKVLCNDNFISKLTQEEVVFYDGEDNEINSRIDEIKDLYKSDYYVIEKIYHKDKNNYYIKSQCKVKESHGMPIHATNNEHIEAAFQALYILFGKDFALKEVRYNFECLEHFNNLSNSVWINIKLIDGLTNNDKCFYEVNILNDKGEILIKIKDLYIYSDSSTSSNINNKLALFSQVWKQRKIRNLDNQDFAKKYIYICGFGNKETKTLVEMLNNKLDEKIFRNNVYGVSGLYEDISTDLFCLIKKIISEKSYQRTLVQVVIPNFGPEMILSGLASLFKTAMLESVNFKGQVISLSEDISRYNLSQVIKDEARSNEIEIAYNPTRQIKCMQEVSWFTDKDYNPWVDNGVYLITGGLGGLGYIFVKSIANSVLKPKFIILGRSVLNDKLNAKITEIVKIGANVDYMSVDINNYNDLKRKINDINLKHKKINAILHVAGIKHDNYVRNKSQSEFKEVMKPKVNGLYYLDKLTTVFDIDYFILFSSISSVLGNVGQIDYSCANGFMDSFSHYRNMLVSKGDRCGKTISINWPLWKDGGMRIDKYSEELMKKTWGTEAIDLLSGLKIFNYILGLKYPQLLVSYGCEQKIMDIFTDKTAITSEILNCEADNDVEYLISKIRNYLIEKINSITKIHKNEIDVDSEFSSFGLDSISFTKLAVLISNEVVVDISPAIFFDSHNIEALSSYLMKEYQPALIKHFNTKINKTLSCSEEIASKNKDRVINNSKIKKKKKFKDSKIAIIGISMNFPKSKNTEEFWQVLINEKDCISEIPKDRWSWEKCFGSPEEKNKTNIKWGGFIDDIYNFEPAFFGISPREALTMDPQQRLIMEYVWKVIEDAGYTSKSLAGTNTGLFIGTIKSGYGEYLEKVNYEVNEFTITSQLPSLGPNRMSYYLNLHGPSVAIETACSSSLVAINRGINALNNNECELVIAGAIHTLFSPVGHISLNKSGMLSKDGRCKPFSNNADGFARGEGIGMIMLKNLEDAQRDGDHIYGTIIGCAENHGGRASSLTAPNSDAQAGLLIKAYENANIDPRTIGYIEAHGTGTKLGDPVEINGIIKAFEYLYEKIPNDTSENEINCKIGSVKSNFGHLELAAGMAGLIKVLLQFKYKKIVKTLHSDNLNKLINLNDTNFSIAQSTCEWKCFNNLSGVKQPLRAGVSSFGIGGVNAHLVLEEYTESSNKNIFTYYENKLPLIITISAKSNKSLMMYVNNIFQYITKKEFDIESIFDLAYTLQVGKDSMEYRICIIAQSYKELNKLLYDYLYSNDMNKSNAYKSNIFKGCVKENKDLISTLGVETDLSLIIERWIKDDEFQKLADLWAKGLDIDWSMLYTRQFIPNRISLPTYPFLHDRYCCLDNIKRKTYYDNKLCNNNTKVKRINEISEDNHEVLLSKPSWIKSNKINPRKINYDKHLYIIGFDETITKRIRSNFVSINNIVEFPFSNIDISKCYTNIALSLLNLIKEIQKSNSQQVKLIQVVLPNYGPGQVLSGLYGLLKTAMLENNLIKGQIIQFGENVYPNKIAKLIRSEYYSSDYNINYKPDRYIKTLSSLNIKNNMNSMPWVNNGIYLITGGLGGLGMIFSESIVKSVSNPNLILIGRSIIDQELKCKIDWLVEKGANVDYITLDLFDYEKTKKIIGKIRLKYKKLNYIIHAAGVIHDSLIQNKDVNCFKNVLTPKVEALCNLDLSLNDFDVDYFVMFSSVASVLGNIGQCDYSCANGFMDSYAKYRNNLVSKGIRSGKTISINWPLWNDGGMDLDNNSKNLMENVWGIKPLQTVCGLNIFNTIVTNQIEQCVVMSGEIDNIKNCISEFVENFEFEQNDNELGSNEAMEKHVKNILTGEISSLTDIDKSKIDVDVDFSVFGFDSVIFTTLANAINKRLNIKCNPSIFYQARNVDCLSTYLIENFDINLPNQTEEDIHNNLFEQKFQTNDKLLKKDNIYSKQQNYNIQLNKSDMPIAIVGVSCKFPMSKDIDEYWNNLISEKDCISQIPKDRWDWNEYYGNPDNEPNKTNIKWGGFIDHVYKFDPLFFGISPGEALLMDPQQRLIMEYIWLAIEDAGYKSKHISGTDTGLFIGTIASGYNELVKKSGMQIIGHTITGQVPSIGPNRMSYFLDIHGPSEAIETSCSTSLVAINRAINAIKLGECNIAIAGAANTLLIPETYISLNKAGMLSKNGRCKTFSDSADGFVRGEGVAMVMLKPLQQAEKDKDFIYASIIGNSVNHGGRTNSLTSPNSQSQAELLLNTYRKSKVDPRTIGYIETHGTGTKLGDPVEINGLNQAFEILLNEFQNTNETEFKNNRCGLGSVKSNIGHLELAAGMAGLIKILLQFKHKKLVKSLHSENLNKYIDFNKSLFYICQETKPWESTKDRLGNLLPRRAGLSSFGFGGTNAHIILEEYIPNKNTDIPNFQSSNLPFVFVLSANEESTLKRYANKMFKYLNENKIDDNALIDITYTFQVGRDEMEKRLGFLVSSLLDLKNKLKYYIDGADCKNKMADMIYFGDKLTHNKIISIFSEASDMNGLIKKLLSNGKLEKLVELWVNGMEVDWECLYKFDLYQRSPQRISLPAYPFNHQKLNVLDCQHGTTDIYKNNGSLINYFVQKNISSFGGVKFNSKFKANEFINDCNHIPISILIQMIISSCRESFKSLVQFEKSINLKDISSLLCLNSYKVGFDIDIEVFERNETDIFGVEIIDKQAQVDNILSQSLLLTKSDELNLDFDLCDLDDIKKKCCMLFMDSKVLYNVLDKNGFKYDKIYHNVKKVLACKMNEYFLIENKISINTNINSNVTDESYLFFDSIIQVISSIHGLKLTKNQSLMVNMELIKIHPTNGSCSLIVISKCMNKKTDQIYNVYAFDDSNKLIVFCKGVEIINVLCERKINNEYAGNEKIDFVSDLNTYLIKKVSELLKIKEEKVNTEKTFSLMGFDSFNMADFIRNLNDEVGLELDPVVLFEEPNLKKLSQYLYVNHKDEFYKYLFKNNIKQLNPLVNSRIKSINIQANKKNKNNKNDTKIAVVGISARLPQSDTPIEFWNNILSERDCITEIPSERWNWNDFYGDPKVEKNKTNVKWGGFINNVFGFDPLFFGISPKEAIVMDPQQRLIMQYVWLALEDAGYSPSTFSGTKTGVFIGIAQSEYSHLIRQANIPIEGYMSTGTLPSLAPNRVSYFLNLHGPSEPVEASCASSLLAINRAISSIKSGECNVVIAGGVHLLLAPESYISLNKAGMLSFDGRCKTFSADANGYARGEGIGMVVLKPLEQAERDGDHIYGTIIGSAENHGGRSNSLTSPNPKAQTKLLISAYKEANVDPRTISYIEAHGTGTELGDPIEIKSIQEAFKQLYNSFPNSTLNNKSVSHCGIGSVKSNIGHLEMAAGVAGLIKVLYQFKYKTICKSLHCDELNPYIKLDSTPFYISQKTSEWERYIDKNGEEIPRRAGISSFGFGGLNSHVVVEEYIQNTNSLKSSAIKYEVESEFIFILSARRKEQLIAYANKIIRYIDNMTNEVSLKDFIYTLQIGRQSFNYRLAIIVKSFDQLKLYLCDYINSINTSNKYSLSVNMYEGIIEGENETRYDSMNDTLSADDIFNLLKSKKYSHVAKLWVGGRNIDWNLVYSDNKSIKRVSIPTYPFSTKSYHVDFTENKQENHTEIFHDNEKILNGTDYQLNCDKIYNELEKKSNNLITQYITNDNVKQQRDLDQILFLFLYCITKSFYDCNNQNQIISRYSKWFETSLMMLSENKNFNFDENTLEIGYLWSRWKSFKDTCVTNQDLSSKIPLLEVCLKNIEFIITGKKVATDIVFPNSSFHLVEGFYKDSELSSIFNETLCQSLSYTLNSQLKNKNTIKILEVGAGTGGTTEPVLKLLGKYYNKISEYCYTDLSRAFLLHANKNYNDLTANLTTAIFDVSQPIKEQKIKENYFDIIIASNVLHTTKDIRKTMQNIIETMNDQSTIILNEISSRTISAHLTFGLLDGWWLYEDSDIRIPGCPGINHHNWEVILKEEGFNEIKFPIDKNLDAVQQIIIANRGYKTNFSANRINSLEIKNSPENNIIKDDKKVEITIVENFLTKLISKTLEIEYHEINIKEPLSIYGLDSILVVKLTSELKNVFKDMTSATILEKQTIKELSSYLYTHNKDDLSKIEKYKGF